MDKRDLDIQLQTAEWALKITNDLIEEYKKCKTENCKSKIEEKLRGLCQRLEYEENKMAVLLQKEKNEGFEI